MQPQNIADEPGIWRQYFALVRENQPEAEPLYLDRFSFYDRAQTAFAVAITGEQTRYANIILRKGVI